jgi:hypothetical protein
MIVIPKYHYHRGEFQYGLVDLESLAVSEAVKQGAVGLA